MGGNVDIAVGEATCNYAGVKVADRPLSAGRDWLHCGRQFRCSDQIQHALCILIEDFIQNFIIKSKIQKIIYCLTHCTEWIRRGEQ